MGVVFINYRVKDNPLAAATIYKELAGRFGARQVFRDCDSIQAGDHYPTELRAGLERADVLLAVIGPQWNRLTDEHGTLLIQRDDDWVRWEIATAIKRNIRIVPVLLRDVPESAELPSRTILPKNIKKLANLQTIDISQRRLSADLDQLANRLVEMVPSLDAHRVVAAQATPQEVITAPESEQVTPGAAGTKHGNSKITRHKRRLAIMSAIVAAVIGGSFLVVVALTNKPDRLQPPELAGTTPTNSSLAPSSPGSSLPATSLSSDGDSIVWQGPIIVASGAAMDVGHMPIEVTDLVGAIRSSFYFYAGDIQAGGEMTHSAWTGSRPPTAAECANQLRVQSVPKLAPNTGLAFCTSGQEVTRIAYAKVTSYDLNANTLYIQLVVWRQELG
jgi:hypothetical protein